MVKVLAYAWTGDINFAKPEREYFLGCARTKEPFFQIFELFRQEERFCWKFGPYINGYEVGIDEKSIIFTIFDKIGFKISSDYEPEDDVAFNYAMV